ncbi:MAG TPA: methyl-accepting chemotaxis protein [Dongiaceae bacterium]|nr:methyl-accepting chemotaxis protein [Dongiaceae bacterium]
MGIATFLHSISWKYKLAAVVLIPVLVGIAIGGISAFTIRDSTHELHRQLLESQQHQDTASTALVAILDFDRSLQALIAADQPDAIRTSAIATIKAASTVDEQVQRLRDAIPDNPKVTQLAERLQALKGPQMKVLGAAKKNDDAAALEQVSAMAGDFNSLVQLAQQILQEEQTSLSTLAAQNETHGRDIITMLSLILVLGIAAAVVLGLVLVRLLLRSLQQVRGAMSAFAQGNLALNLPAAGNDELGLTIHSLRNATDATRNIVASIRQQAQGLNTDATGVVDAAHRNMEQARELDNNVEAIRARSSQLSDMADQVLDCVHDSAAEAERTADACRLASNTINETLHRFSQFQQDMNNALQKAQELASSAGTISSITQTIRNISEQTNLLALNAAIEAARAGEQGRGFAVVADEVRSLAQRSGEAVAEISNLAAAMTKAVEESVAALDKATRLVTDNIDSIRATGTSTDSASASAGSNRQQMQQVQTLNQQQKAVIDQINTVVQQLAVIASHTQQDVSQLDALSGHLRATSQNLNQLVSHFS